MAKLIREVSGSEIVNYRRDGFPIMHTREQGPFWVQFHKGKISAYEYYISFNTNDKSVGLNYYDKIKRQISTRFPEHRVTVNNDYSYVSLTTGKPSLTGYVSFTYYKEDNVVAVQFFY